MTENQKQIILDMIVEIPKNTSVKYEFDDKIAMMRCDRFLSTNMTYPGNYGYIPETLGGDGDPLDILLISDYALVPGIIIQVKVLGYLETRDEKGNDEKLIAVPSDKVDLSSKQKNELKDLGETTLDKIKHFFEHYKENDKGKWVITDKFKGIAPSIELIKKCKNEFNLLDTNVINSIPEE